MDVWLVRSGELWEKEGNEKIRDVAKAGETRSANEGKKKKRKKDG